MTDFVTIIKDVGFPIAVCIAAFIAIKYIYDDNRKIIDNYQKSYSKFADALNKNTTIIERLIEKLDKEK